MIKRRFYRYEHGSRDAPSESSSSSESEVEVEAEASDGTEIEQEEDDDDVDNEEDDVDKEEEENVTSDVREKGEASSSSGYESEDSSVNEVNLDSSGLPTSDDDVATQSGSQNIIGGFFGIEGNNLPTIVKDETDINMADCVIKCKSVFKCKLCPRIVCLSEETLKAHLASKKHARSEKLLKEGRLKLMLNDDGEIEGETPSESRAAAAAAEAAAAAAVSEQKSSKPNKKGKGRGKPRKRPRQKETESEIAKPSTRKREKRRKNDD